MRGAPPKPLHFLHRLLQASNSGERSANGGDGRGKSEPLDSARTLLWQRGQSLRSEDVSEATHADEDRLGKVGGGSEELGVGKLERGISRDGGGRRWRRKCNGCSG